MKKIKNRVYYAFTFMIVILFSVVKIATGFILKGLTKIIFCACQIHKGEVSLDDVKDGLDDLNSAIDALVGF